MRFTYEIHRGQEPDLLVEGETLHACVGPAGKPVRVPNEVVQISEFEGARAMDRNLAMEVVRVTEAAALACARLMGRGDEKAADQAAVDAMRRAFNDRAASDGTVVIGEGERDEAPMLYIGEKVGRGRGRAIAEVDIALDPLEGTTLCATGGTERHRR